MYKRTIGNMVVYKTDYAVLLMSVHSGKYAVMSLAELDSVAKNEGIDQFEWKGTHLLFEYDETYYNIIFGTDTEGYTSIPLDRKDMAEFWTFIRT